jgi:hypothetical protein
MFSCHSLHVNFPFKKGQRKSGILFFGVLHDVDLQLVSDASGQPIDPIFKGQEFLLKNGADRLYRNVDKQLPNYTAYNPRRGKASTTPQRKASTTPQRKAELLQ